MRLRDINWTKEKLVKEILNKRYMLDMGAGKLAGRYGTERALIKEAKREAKLQLAAQSGKNLPKILIFDIETSPLEAYIWQKEVWKAHVSDEKLISNWFTIAWSAKWLFSNEVMGDVLTSKEAINENDERIVRSLWELFNEADIVIAHNAANFDVPNMNTRFIVNDLNPPKSYQMIDTLKVARRQFGFTHNSLNALAKLFDIPVKLETSFDLWRKCKHGDEKALTKMLKYNKHDVEILELVYLKIRPWIRSHPNVGLFTDSEERKCPVCGSPVKPDGGHYYTMVGKFKTYRCENKSCRAISRGRKSVFNKEHISSLNVSLAR